MRFKRRSRSEKQEREAAIEQRARQHRLDTMPIHMRGIPDGHQIHRIARLLPGDNVRSETEALAMAREMPWYRYGAGVEYRGYDARWYVWSSRAAA